jgi:hypothetical protein
MEQVQDLDVIEGEFSNLIIGWLITLKLDLIQLVFPILYAGSVSEHHFVLLLFMPLLR